MMRRRTFLAGATFPLLGLAYGQTPLGPKTNINCSQTAPKGEPGSSR